MKGLTIAKVAVDNAAYTFDMLFDYTVPDFLLSSVKAGKRVYVPFGKSSSKRIGMVYAVYHEETDKELKNIISVIDENSLLNKEMLLTSSYIKEHTFSTFSECYHLFMPAAYNFKIKNSYEVDNSYTGNFEELNDLEKSIYDYLLNKKSPISELTISKNFKIHSDTSVIERMCSLGILKRVINKKRLVNDALVKMVRINYEIYDDSLTLTKKQTDIIDALKEYDSASINELSELADVSISTINTLIEKNIIYTYNHEIYRQFLNADNSIDKAEIKLSNEQNKAFNGIYELYSSNEAKAALLFGVTGSGKTQVYLKLIDEVMKSDKGVIVLIPEISLTPQLLSIFYKRYGNKVAVFHSALSMGERLDEWKRVKKGAAQIAIGTRSAVFAPFEKIGLIIIDEEQEHTYKSEMSPRYHAKDVASYRVAYHKGLLLLSSATPSFDSYTKAVKGSYKLFSLEERYGKSVLPDVKIVDTIYHTDMLGNLSKELSDALIENFYNKHQSIILLNRRGYNTFVSCTNCGNVVSCPNCSLPLTYHIRSGKMMCHYCGYSAKLEHTCSNCGNDTIKFAGIGTQKLEDELVSLLPEAKILRMDADTTVSKYSYKEKYDSFASGEYDIMVGTQMVAKGLDFPNVTLVGVLSVDQMLYNDDYKSGERVFDLITQVVGRCGRSDLKGTAYIQTQFPESEIITLAKKQDYVDFYNLELDIRKQMIYPPYCDLLVIGFSGINEAFTYKASVDFLEELKKEHTQNYISQNIIVLGPAAPKINKVANKYRFRLIIKCRDNRDIREMINKLLINFKRKYKTGSVNIYADINPSNLG